MKNPLRYQITEFDCGPTCFTNAVSFLFEREEIPCEILKAIYHYTLDMFGPDGKSDGTTIPATRHLSYFLNELSKVHKFELICDWHGGSEIDSDFIKKEMKENTVIILRVWSEYEHYVLLTGMDDKYLYLFDPYYDSAEEFKGDNEVKVIEGNFKYNRKVNINRLDLIDNEKDYTLGVKEDRECVIIRRK